ncbi:hypothetical protein PI125_g25030 [Phytophthora idaei]|nr:hypothetical protein PI125_g25030 [Phytophthora idaei]
MMRQTPPSSEPWSNHHPTPFDACTNSVSFATDDADQDDDGNKLSVGCSSDIVDEHVALTLEEYPHPSADWKRHQLHLCDKLMGTKQQFESAAAASDFCVKVPNADLKLAETSSQSTDCVV